MVNKTAVRAAGIVLLALIGTAHAQLDDTKAPITVSDLDAILQEEIMLKAMAARAKQQAELSRYAGSANLPHAAPARVPQIAWRRATASGWLAKFILGDGTAVIAGVGERLSGNFEITRIDADGVTLERNGQPLELTAAGASATADASEPNTPHGLSGRIPMTSMNSRPQ